ncbi:hypothetical protein [Enterococcus sp. AZ163]|uniref:hypothetical protein n=1 Tax=Enterococcus sp. AZ163 TaxID=2774638 RepID=UPI003D2DD178
MGSLLEKCKPNFKSCPIGKLDTNSVAYFYKLRDPNRCNIYGFKASEAAKASILYSYNYADKPDEKVCGLDKCDMTGTLFVTPSEAGAEITTEIKANSEDFQYGYLRVFINGNKGDAFDLSVMNMTGTEANKFTVALEESGWNAIVVELFNPAEIVSGGWVADNGAIKLVINSKQAEPFRLSTAELFEDIFGMVKDQTIGFTCVSDFSGDPALTLTEDLCDIPQYDETATTIERSLTATNIIGELADFHNITKRQKNSEHLVQTRDRFTAKEVSLNGIDYASFTIPELADIKCPRLLVQPQNCEFDTLYHVDIDNDTTTIDLPEEQFFRKGNKVYMSKAYADTEVVVAYPIWIEGTAWDITTEDLNKQHYQMEMVTPICGDEYVIKADNVMLTALPFTWTNAAGTFTVTYSMAKDSYGKYGTIIKIDQRK